MTVAVTMLNADTKKPLLELILPIMEKAPSLEKFNATEWKDTTCFPAMSELYGKMEMRTVEAYLGATEEKIFFAVVSELPPDGSKPLAETDEKVKIGRDEAVEFFAQANPGGRKGITYQGLLTPAGAKEFIEHAYGGGKAVPDWQKKVTFNQEFTDKHWIVLGSIDASAFGSNIKTSSAVWALSLCRDWMRPTVASSAPGIFNGRNVRVKFVKGAPAIQFHFEKDPFTKVVQGNLTAKNTGKTETEIKGLLEVTSDAMPETRKAVNLKLKGGKTASVKFLADMYSNCMEMNFKMKFQNKLGSLMNLQYTWKMPARKSRWVLTRKKVLPFDFDFSFYPTQNILRVYNKLSHYPGSLPKEIVYTVRETKTGKEIKSFNVPAKDKLESRLKLPELNGKYTVTMNLGKKSLSKNFERKHFEWENCKWGTSRKVYPPFTEMEVKDNTVSTVFRDHKLDGTGLPAQITVKNNELMAGPAVLLLNGKPIKGKLKFTEKSADVVETESVLSGKDFSGKAIGHWEFDGALKYSLTLNPGKIDSLILEIPLKDKQVPMIHALGAMRYVTAKKLAPKEGVLWNASQEKNQVKDNFSPYVYLGSPLRGLSFFAENDKNWSWNRETPNMEVVRKGNEVILRVNLVNKPLTITKPRIITFGLQAAPVKPRLPNWRTFWRGGKYGLMSCDYMWFGGPGNCGSVHPPNGDMYFWEMLKRIYVPGAGKPWSKEDIAELHKRIEKTFAPYDNGPEIIASWKRIVKIHASRSPGAMKWILYFNRSVHNGLKEFNTFIDEWGTYSNYVTREQPLKNGEIKILPSKSYLDFAIYWHVKSLDYINHGVYCDNYFPSLSYNTEMTDAYVDEDGSIVPAAGIWGLREYGKRVFQMFNEKGLPPIFFPHMTSTGVLPYLAFATVQLDWEWKYGAGEVQTRFSRPYCAMVSNGELAGAIPVLLTDRGERANDPLVQRSFVGVCMIHELDGDHDGPGKVWKTLFHPAYEQYYQNPNLKVYRYWDDSPVPVSVSDSDFSWILYSVPGKKALLILVSYKDTPGAVNVSLDLKQIGLENATAKNFETGADVLSENGKLKLKMGAYEVLAIEFKENKK
jgi:hypothetical protein